MVDHCLDSFSPSGDMGKYICWNEVGGRMVISRRRVFWVGGSNIYHLSQLCAPKDAKIVRTDDEFAENIERKGLLCNRCCYGYAHDRLR